jgi:hypothetical protein
MAASAALALAPGSTERQARSGAAAVTGNAVSDWLPRTGVLGRVPTQAAAGIWRVFGVTCLLSLVVCWFFGGIFSR